MRLFNIWIKPKKINHKILKHFLKKTDAGGRFFILFFISSKTDAGRRFVVFFLKNRRGMYLHEPLYSRQCSMGGVLHVRPLMIFVPIQEPCWT